MQVLSAESAASSTQSSATDTRSPACRVCYVLDHHSVAKKPSPSLFILPSYRVLPLPSSLLLLASPPPPPWIQVCGLKQSEDLNELNELNMSVLRCPRIQLSVLSFLSLLSRCWRQGCLRCLRTSHRGLLAGPCCLRPAQHSTAARVNTRKKVVP